MTKKNSKIIIISSCLAALVVQTVVWGMTALTAEGISFIKGLSTIPFGFGRFLLTWLIIAAFLALGAFLHDLNSKTAFLNTIDSAFTQKRVLTALASFVLILFVFRVNNFNILGYIGLVPNNIKAANMISLGQTRGVRSDEWQSIAEYFHNDFVGNLKLLWAKKDNFLQVADNILRMLTPLHWGDLYLPISFNLSWNYILMYAVGLYGFYRLFHIITGSKKFSAAAAFIIVYSPQFQWWWGPKDFGMLTCFVVFFHDFFEADKVWKKLLYAYGLVSLAYVIIENAYPAWDVPMIYLLLFILVAIYLTEKRFNIKKTDIPYILVVVSLFAVMLLAYFYKDPETTSAEMNTVYPGSRFITGGGLDFSWLGNYLIMPFVTWKDFTIQDTLVSNISAHLTLFPLPYIIFILYFKEFRKNKVMCSLCLFSLLCMVFMFVNIGEKLATITFLYLCQTDRVCDLWGLSLLMLLLLECYTIKPSYSGFIKNKKNCICLAVTLILMAAYLAYNVFTRPDFNYLAGGALMAYWIILILLMSGMLSLGMKRSFISLMLILTIVSGVMVNPLNIGCSIMYKTPLAEKVREINDEDPGNWVALDNFVLSKYIYAQGVECLNYLNWPPRFDLFSPLDENGENSDIYNRYAHINVELTDAETYFVLDQGDKFTLYMNYNDLEKWDVKYLAVQWYPQESGGNVELEQIYFDELDEIYIYKVNYK